jgi:hypothetical protein
MVEASVDFMISPNVHRYRLIELQYMEAIQVWAIGHRDLPKAGQNSFKNDKRQMNRHLIET